MDNDTNCFLLGEARFGQARGKKHVVALTLGTGVGGAVLIDGKLLRGKHGSAGELGHMVIDRGKTIEDLASSHVFSEHPLAVQNRAFTGDKKAKKIYEEIGKHLGVALANLVNIFDPELILIGGGIAKAGPLFLPASLRQLRKHVLIPASRLPPVKISRLKYAGALGAVSLFS